MAPMQSPTFDWSTGFTDAASSWASTHWTSLRLMSVEERCLLSPVRIAVLLADHSGSGVESGRGGSGGGPGGRSLPTVHAHLGGPGISSTDFDAGDPPALTPGSAGGSYSGSPCGCATPIRGSASAPTVGTQGSRLGHSPGGSRPRYSASECAYRHL